MGGKGAPPCLAGLGAKAVPLRACDLPASFVWVNFIEKKGTPPDTAEGTPSMLFRKKIRSTKGEK